MARQVNITLSDTINSWRQKTNLTASYLGDLDNLIAGIVQREIQKSMERERRLRMAAQAKKLEVNKPELPKPKLEEGLVKKYEKPADKEEEVSKSESKKEIVKEIDFNALANDIDNRISDKIVESYSFNFKTFTYMKSS